jgi:hypothetical protein
VSETVLILYGVWKELSLKNSARKPAWKEKEFSDAKKVGGRRQKGSGNLWYAPGDVRSDNFLIDDKTTKHKSFSITTEIWDKLYEEALFSYRIPALSLKIQETELVVLSLEDFLKIKEKANL